MRRLISFLGYGDYETLLTTDEDVFANYSLCYWEFDERSAHGLSEQACMRLCGALESELA